jgi:hypothetical protein
MSIHGEVSMLTTLLIAGLVGVFIILAGIGHVLLLMALLKRDRKPRPPGTAQPVAPAREPKAPMQAIPERKRAA